MRRYCRLEHENIIERDNCYRQQSGQFHTLTQKMIKNAAGETRNAMRKELGFRVLEVRMIMNSAKRKSVEDPEWNTGPNRTSEQSLANEALWPAFSNIAVMSFGSDRD